MFHMLRAMGGASASAGPPTCTFITTASSGVSGASQTLSSVSLGTASATRVIVVAFAAAASTAAINSVTIAGVTATKAVEKISASNALSIWYAAVPTGTTGTITATYASTTFFPLVGVWALTNLTSNAPFSTGSGTTSATLSTPASGFMIAAASDYLINSTTFGMSISVVTKDYGTAYNNYTSGCCTNDNEAIGGHVATSSGSSTPTITSSAASGAPAMAAATWH